MKVGLKDLLTSRVLKEITTRYHLDLNSVKEIDTFENFIYEAKKFDEDYILRISHNSYRTKDQIEAEIDWIDFLKKEDLPIVQPIRSINNQFVEEIKLEDSSFFTTLFEKAPGDTIANNPTLMTPKIIKKWGGILGKFHTLTKKYSPRGPKRKQWYSHPEVANIDEILTDYPIILNKAKQHIDFIKSLPQDKDSYGLIHYDLHEINVLVDGENITIIDFDDCQYDYFVSDFASILFQVAWRFHTKERSRESVIKEFYPQFMKGYLREYPLSNYWIEKIPDFPKLRHIVLFCTLIIEQQLEFDEWAQKIINWWIPMLEKDQPWINIDFKKDILI